MNNVLSEIIKKEITYKTNNIDSTVIKFGNKKFKYNENCSLNSEELLYHSVKYASMFDFYVFKDWSDPDISIDPSKFEIYRIAANNYHDVDNHEDYFEYRLKSIIPMHCDTFFIMHRYIRSAHVKKYNLNRLGCVCIN